jgi:hypothetical protein
MLSIGIPGHCQNVDLQLLTPPDTTEIPIRVDNVMESPKLAE